MTISFYILVISWTVLWFMLGYRAGRWLAEQALMDLCRNMDRESLRSFQAAITKYREYLRQKTGR